MSLSTELQKRGFINQYTGESLSEIIDKEPVVVYHGIDPTADSAHAGNFVNWMLLRHLAKAGHKIVFLVGGGTGMIGDPKSDVERPMSLEAEVVERVGKLRAQAERLFEGVPVEFVNNHDWLATLNLVEFLRDTGKHFTINDLIKKEAIAARLAGENGISYTEFAYPLLQAYDYLTLYRKYNCRLQVGGSDQWGNMLAGVDLIRRVEEVSVNAITVPLIVDKTTGKKFGKSEGNAVWLDAKKTSPYQFYQFWLNISDENVVDYLKLFTDYSLDEIDEMRLVFEKNPESREVQTQLAMAITTIVHGEEVATAAKNVSEILFGNKSIAELSVAEVEMLLVDAPVYDVVVGKNILDVLVESDLATSKREARTFIESGAVSLSDEKVTSIEKNFSETDFLNDIAIIKRGKKQLRVIRKK